MAKPQDPNKPKFIRKNGKIIPIGADKKKKGMDGRKTVKSGEFSGSRWAMKKKITKVGKAEKKFYGKRNKIIGKHQKFGVTSGTALGVGIASALKKGSKGLLKGGLLGAGVGIVAGTVSGVRSANKKVGTQKKFSKQAQKILRGTSVKGR